MKKLIIMSVTCMIIIISLMLTTLQSSNTAPTSADEKRILLLTDVEKGDFYLQAEQGIQDAALYTGTVLRVEMLDFNHLLPQTQAIAEQQYSAILLYMENKASIQNVLKTLEAARIPIVTIGDASSKWCVIEDAQEDASILVRAAKNNPCSSLAVYGNKENAVFVALINNDDMLVHIITDPLHLALPENSCVISLDKDITESLLAQKKQNKLFASVPLFSTDAEDTWVANLENGYLSAMLLPRPYSFGYLSLQMAISIKSMKQTGETIKVPSIYVTKDTIYSLEIANTVFPLLQ